MSEKKKFKRGVGFTFTPSRVPDDEEVDYIDEINRLLSESLLSQNKFIEKMLKDAIKYNKLKALNRINTDIQQNQTDITETTNEALNKSTPDDSSSKSERLIPEGTPVGIVNKIQITSPSNEIPIANLTIASSESIVNDPITQRALERANRTRLKPQ
ncbi:hypothetical protein [Paenibacillus periandrae]|uniref:hypothetical protein n=1 Tax=Paenibacillus periandrae TaxID=1761741 RepID=UPI001F094EF8|nr:hypothetical protein [Paenibacillus periandrae]